MRRIMLLPGLFNLAGEVREILSASAEILSTAGGNSLAEGEILSAPERGLISFKKSLRSNAAHELHISSVFCENRENRKKISPLNGG